ncbi:MAG: tryptophan--tRNA ligase [Patescibacteria group bacterium]|nr:tryptophan--tRNA ligase [Patescibacteria group bacterium]
MTNHKKIIVSGIQPTGALHLGNYLGAIKNWLELQEKFDCFFFIADYHSITIPYDQAEKERQTLETAKDLVALGITKSKLFAQSQIPEVTELAWIFNSITPIAELERMTQFKDKASQHKENINAGLFTYPVLQAADILIYGGELVPVGEDQIQHVELTRVIAKKFDKLFGKTFPETEAYLTKIPRLKSLQDPAKKMSKSLGDKHCLYIFEDEANIRAKIAKAVTTPEGIANLKLMTEILSGAKEKFDEKNNAKSKEKLADLFLRYFATARAKRKMIPDSEIIETLRTNAALVRPVAQKTIADVRKKIGLAKI